MTLDELKEDMDEAERTTKRWFFSFAFFLLVIVADEMIFKGSASTGILFIPSFICVAGGAIASHTYYLAFQRYWSANGLDSAQIKAKWRELNPGD